MRGDFSSFWKEEEKRNFNGVLHQQGRVLLDRDWNAQTEIFNDWQETAAADIIGAGVAAVPAEAAESFKVTNAKITTEPAAVKITVNEGRVWADGLLIELRDADPLKNDVEREAVYFEPPVQEAPGSLDDLPNDVRDAVILEAWHEELNAFQKPELLIEPALGGVDTTERFQTAFRFRLFRMKPDDTCDSIIESLKDKFKEKGKLTAVLKADETTDDDCPVAKVNGYTGFEHQLYRIEIARQTKHPDDVYFKWSQFNGGLVGRGTFDETNRKLKIDANQNAILNSGLTAFYLETLRKIDGWWQVVFATKATLNTSDNTLTLPADTAEDFFGTIPTPDDENDKSFFFRLWDDIRPIGDFAAETAFKDGISLHFEADTGDNYTPHDFWTFAVRAGEIENHTPLIDNQPPEGIFYHRVPLAELNWTSEEITAQSGDIEDCRRIFQPLTKLKGCCTYSVGDGVNSHGDFTSIQEAINHLPKKGGQICILPGEYRGRILLDKTTRNRNISIKGCGNRTHIIGDPGQAAIHVRGGINLKIESLSVMASDGDNGILLEGDEIVANEDDNKRELGSLRNVKLENLRVIAARKSAIELRVGQYVSIRGCQIFIKDENSEWQAAVYLAGDDLLFEENEIRVMTTPDERMKFGKTDAPEAFNEAEKAAGGLHLGGGCERVRVVNNLIIGGTGNGITLGSIDVETTQKIEKHIHWQKKSGRPTDKCDHQPGILVVTVINEETRFIVGDPLRDILIERNRIFSMGLNGIGVDGFFAMESDPNEPNRREQKKIQFISVENLTIIGNRIEFCLNNLTTELPPELAKFAGYGGIALADVGGLVARDNFIRDNGASFLEPVCGIFILFGRGVEISRNHILNNGRVSSARQSDNLKSGARGGIFIFIATPGAMPIGQASFLSAAGFDGAARANGIPALKLHENIVAVPVGRALTMFSTGNLSITDNQFLTQSVPREINIFSLLAASVLIFSFNSAKNSSGAGFTNASQGKTKAQYSTAPPQTAPTVNVNAATGLSTATTDFGRGFFLGGSIQFAGNQCELLSGGFPAISAILILSLDDVGFLGNQTSCVLGGESFLLADTIIYGANVRASDNSWREIPARLFYSAITIGAFLNTTTDNHSTRCLLVTGRLFLDRYNLTMVEALGFTGNNDIVEISENPQIQMPCRPARRILSGYGRPRQTTAGGLSDNINVRNTEK